MFFCVVPPLTGSVIKRWVCYLKVTSDIISGKEKRLNRYIISLIAAFSSHINQMMTYIQQIVNLLKCGA